MQMNHTVKLVLNKNYFTEMFSQSMRYANKWRKIERVIGPFFLVLGIFLFVITDGKMASPFVLVLIGLYEILSPLIKKPWWIGRQMKSNIANSEVTINFTETGIETSTPYSQSSIEWTGVERILETKKGVLIWPQKGIHIYIPKSDARKDVIQFITTKNV